jgi:hypothetical protein
MGLSFLSEARTRIPMKSFNFREAFSKAATLTMTKNQDTKSPSPILKKDTQQKISDFLDLKLLKKRSSMLILEPKLNYFFMHKSPDVRMTLPSTFYPMQKKESGQNSGNFFQSKSQKSLKNKKKTRELFQVVIKNEKNFGHSQKIERLDKYREKGNEGRKSLRKRANSREGNDKRKKILAKIPQPAIFTEIIN